MPIIMLSLFLFPKSYKKKNHLVNKFKVWQLIYVMIVLLSFFRWS